MTRTYKVADLHCDTIWRIKRGADLSERSRQGHIDIPRFREGGVALQFFAVYVHAHRLINGYFETALSTVRLIRKTIEDFPDDLELATTAAGARRANRRGKIAVVISIEGLHVLDGKLRGLRIHFNAEKCAGDWQCYEVCPVGCWTPDRERHKAVFHDSEQCIACGACALQCPQGAIELR